MPTRTTTTASPSRLDEDLGRLDTIVREISNARDGDEMVDRVVEHVEEQAAKGEPARLISHPCTSSSFFHVSSRNRRRRGGEQAGMQLQLQLQAAALRVQVQTPPVPSVREVS